MGDWEIWISLGNFIDFNGGRNKPHQHSFFEVCLVLEGRGMFLHKGKNTPLNKGDLFIADPETEHEIISHKTNSLKIQFISFSFQKISETEQDRITSLNNMYIASFLDKHSRVVRSSGTLESYFRQLKIISEAGNDGEWYIRSEGVARSLILEIMIMSIEEDSRREESSDMDFRLQTALKFITDNSRRKLSVEEIAGQSCSSIRTLRRLMKQYCGKTVVQKCLETRIGRSAQYLIAHPEKTVSEISYFFGFNNPSDFGRTFKQLTGKSPGEFRETKGTVFIDETNYN